MSDIDFQNGFIVGMATRGITRSGLQYEPIVWNDDGVYSYFYIDFKQPLQAFSHGMLTESIIVHDSEQLTILGINKVSESIYKIVCDITGKVSGVTVVNKKNSLLQFLNGQKVPPFSVFFYVAGIVSYIKVGYAYDYTEYNVSRGIEHFNESVINTSFWEAFVVGYFYDFTDYSNLLEDATITETVSIILT